MVYIFLFLLQLLVLYFLSKRLQKKLYQVLYKLTKSRKATVWLTAVFFLPGTLIHEVSHLLAALLLLIPVGELEIIPEIDGNEIKLGSVAIGKTDPFRRFLVGAAPFIAGVLAIIATLYFVSFENIFDNPYLALFVFYLIFCIGNTMFLSKKDLEGAWILIAALSMIFIIVYIAGFRTVSIDINAFPENHLIGIFKKANFFLMVPILLDIAMLIPLSIMTRKK
jgi:hypothetical protein